MRKTRLAAMLAAMAMTVSAAAQAREVVVFAAASLTETMTQIEALYEAAHPETDVVCSYDSSGTLKAQIEQGAPCDLFISAGQKQMDALEAGGLLAEGTRADLLTNRVVLVGDETKVTGFDALADALAGGDVLLAMGNSDVPVGQYTQEILLHYGLDEAALAGAGCITYGSNVKEVTTQVAQGSVDCGVIYATDAFSAGLPVIDEATADRCSQVVYPAAVMAGGNEADARELMAYLMGDEAMGVFEGVGFASVSDADGGTP